MPSGVLQDCVGIIPTAADRQDKKTHKALIAKMTKQRVGNTVPANLILFALLGPKRNLTCKSPDPAPLKEPGAGVAAIVLKVELLAVLVTVALLAVERIPADSDTDVGSHPRPDLRAQALAHRSEMDERYENPEDYLLSVQVVTSICPCRPSLVFAEKSTKYTLPVALPGLLHTPANINLP